MKLSEFTTLLRDHSDAGLLFLVNGGHFAAHAHVTEVGRVEKLFLDCGGKPRRHAVCQLQLWEYTDTDHRLSPSKLLGILDKAAPLFGGEDLAVEVELEDGLLSQFPVTEGGLSDGRLVFQLEQKHVACLAMDICVPQEAGKESCCGGSTGCCA